MVLGFSETDKRTGQPTNFRGLILDGVKLHSLRAGKRWKEGMPIQMATGVRTKSQKVFNKDREDLSTCQGVQDVTITAKETEGLGIHFVIMVDSRRLSRTEATLLATNDGFNSLYDFLTWFHKDGDFDGQIVHWTTLKY